VKKFPVGRDPARARGSDFLTPRSANTGGAKRHTGENGTRKLQTGLGEVAGPANFFQFFLRVLGVVFTTIATGPVGGYSPLPAASFAHEFAVLNFVPYLAKQSQYPV
jgi:hypothetical protein